MLIPQSDADVPALWRGLGLPGLVDVHVHFLPAPMLAKVWRWFDSVEEITGVAWPITYREDDDARLGRLQQLGVRAFPALVYPHKAGMAEWLNGWAAEFAARTPGCLRTATLFPEPSAGDYVPRELAAGVQVWKVHIQVGDFDPREPVLDAAWGAIADAGTPVVMHCGSGPQPGRFTGPGPTAELLARHPGLRLVIAHLGMPEYADFLDLAERYERVHLDTTMAFTDFTERLLPFPRELAGRLGDLGDRILFGSDFPNIPHTYAHAVGGVVRVAEEEGLGADWLRAVLHDNGARLLDLGG